LLLVGEKARKDWSLACDTHPRLGVTTIKNNCDVERVEIMVLSQDGHGYNREDFDDASVL